MSRHPAYITKEPDGSPAIGSLRPHRRGGLEYQHPFFVDDVEREIESCAGLQVPVLDLYDEWYLQRNPILRRAIDGTYAHASQANARTARSLRRLVPTAFRQGHQRLL